MPLLKDVIVCEPAFASGMVIMKANVEDTERGLWWCEGCRSYYFVGERHVCHAGPEYNREPHD